MTPKGHFGINWPLESGSFGTESRPERSGLESPRSNWKKSRSDRTGSDSSGFVSKIFRIRNWFSGELEARKGKGGFYSEKADAFVISPNRRT